MKYYAFKICCIVILLILVTTSRAQGDLREHRDFFQSQARQYNEWLQHSTLGDWLEVAGVEVTSSYATLNLKSRSADLDTLSVVWAQLAEAYDAEQSEALPKRLFRRWAFLSETGIDSLMLIIEPDNRYFTIEVTAEDGNITVYEDIPPAEIKGRGLITVKLQASQVARLTTRNKDTEQQVAEKIRKHLLAYYREKGSFFSGDPEIQVIDYSDGEFALEIQNIKSEIIDDSNYFELIEIYLLVDQEDEVLEVRYDIDAKYGRGFFSGPRLSDYRPMDGEYAGYLQKYEAQLRSSILNLVKN